MLSLEITLSLVTVLVLALTGSPRRSSKIQKWPKTKPIDQQGTGASSSGLTPEERARSMTLPTTDEAEDSVPLRRSQGPDPEYDGSADTGQFRQLLGIQKILWLNLSFWTTVRGVS